MNYGLDLRASLSRPTGVGSYVLSLAERLPGLAPDDHFYYFSSSWSQRYPEREWPQNVTLRDRRLPVRLLNFAWNRLGGPGLDRLVGARLDLVHSPHPLCVPARRAKQIVTLHDLFFLKHPDMTGAEIRRDYAPLVRENVARADGVICVSQHTANEAKLLLEVPDEKISVIPNGVDPIYREPVDEREVEEILLRRRLPRGGLLFVGSEEKRKNLVNLAMAYLGVARSRKHCPPLLLVGPGSHWAKGGAAGGPQIRAVGYLAKKEIRALMAASLALVLPSLEEGFGLPVAEAMAAGLPVLCSQGSALEEVADGAALLVNPLETASIARGIESVADEPSRLEEMRRRGLEVSKRYDWDLAAAATIESYRKVLGV